MKILVTGGAGYIGSHTVKALGTAGFDCLVFDNFSTGRMELVRGREVVRGDLLDLEETRGVFRRHPIQAVLHFASLTSVGESCKNPHLYYHDNLLTSLNLLKAMLEAGTNTLIFSSSAAVYGVPLEIPIPETHAILPVNPYGRTKAAIEHILEDISSAHGLRYISLRYFNAAGADAEGGLGELHDPETHLIPNALLTVLGKKPRLEVFGTDFPTPDGTPLRDYIHVSDLAEAHILALKALLAGAANDVFNLGTEKGHSVLEVIRKVGEITGKRVPWSPAPRRAGDVPVLMASKNKAEKTLGWKPRRSTIEEIIESAWAWHSKTV